MFPSNNKKQATKKKVANNSQHMEVTSSLHGLSECGAKYLIAATFPFAEEARGACVPVFPSRPSKKVADVKSAIISTSATGEGFIVVSPCLAKDRNCLWYTDASFVGSEIDIQPMLPTGVLASFMHGAGHGQDAFKDDSLSLASSYVGRMVSVGLRVRCISSVDKIGGLMYMVADSEHNNLNGFSSDDMRNHADCHKVAISNEFDGVSLIANCSNEVDYPIYIAAGSGTDRDRNQIFPFSYGRTIEGGSTATGAAPIAIWISGEPGAKYEFEVIQHTELIGRNVAPSSLTNSHYDQLAFEATQNGWKNSTTARSTKPQASWPKLMLKNAGDFMSEAEKGSRSGLKLLKSTTNAYRNVKDGLAIAGGVAALL